MKWSKLSRNISCVMLAALLLITPTIKATTSAEAATSNSISSPYMTITVNARGSYSIVSQSPSWSFNGNIGQPLTNVVVNTGSDNHVSYPEIDFTYVDKNSANRGAGIRTYNSNPAVLFTDSYASSTSNTLPFPRLSIPGGLFRMSYQYAFAQLPFLNFNRIARCYILMGRLIASSYLLPRTS